MSKKGKIKRLVINKALLAVSFVTALFAVVFSFINFNKSQPVYGLSVTVTTEDALIEALSSSVYDEIILKNSITLSNGTTIDGDTNGNGVKKTIRAEVTGTSDQGVVNDGASTYTLFYVAQNATATIKNCIIKGGGTTAIVNGRASNSTNNNSTLYIDNCQISNSGSTSTAGGGIKNTVGCKVVLTNSSIYRNIANYGAGFQNQQGTFIVDNCSISENRSFQYGGGGGENTGNNGSGTNAYMYIVNSTVANNTSQEIGGGINNCKNGYLYVINSIVAGNATTSGSTASGGGLGNNQSTLVCVDSILLDNVYLSATGATTDQDVYGYEGGNVSLEGCVYGSITGSTQSVVNAVDVDSNSYKASDSDTIFASTKTGSIIDEDGTQGNKTYEQIALVEDENGVPYAPLAADSLASMTNNSSYSTVKVEFDYSDLSNITLKTGSECSANTIAPTQAGSGKLLASDEKILTLTVFVNDDFDIDGGTVYGDSYVVGSSSTESIRLKATPTSGNENKSVLWVSADVDRSRLTYISSDNEYVISLSDVSSIASFYDSTTDSYRMVLQPLTMSVMAEAGDSEVTLNYSVSYSNTFCSGYTLTNSIPSYDIYYSPVNDFENAIYFGSSTTTTAKVTGLTNETPYYFYVAARIDSDGFSGNILGYVTETPEESGVRTYVLASTIESGKEYLIVGRNTSGTGYALVNNSSAKGTATAVTVQTSNGTPYIEVEALDTMLWTATGSGTSYQIKNGTRYIYMSSNTNILSTTARTLTVTTSSIKYGNNGLQLTSTTPSRARNASVYFYELKKAASAPTGIKGSIQSVIGEDSGTITGITTAMEYSTDGASWTSCTSTSMSNMAVGKYFFRYKETLLSYASAPVTVEILEKKIESINVKTNPTLTYHAKDELDLSGLSITIIYNDDTTTDVSYSDFASTSSSVYQRKSGIITTSISNGMTLECSDNNSRITIYLDDFEGQTARLTINHHIVLVPAKEVTCTENGYDDYYVCDSCGNMYSDSEGNNRIYVAPTHYATGHKWGSQAEENRIEPTCEEAGSYDLVMYCTACNEELQRTTVVLSAKGHTWGTQVEENRVEPTCEADGSYDQVAYCTVCDKEISRTTVTLPAIGHDYQNPEWVWDGYNASYQLTCSHDETHKYVIDADMTSEITLNPTCLESGSRLWTATVLYQSRTYTATKEEILAPLGHDYDYSNGSWSWSGYDSVTYICKCLNDETHEVSFDAEITSAITLDPTCTLTGVRTYIAKVVINEITYTDTTEEVIASLGHNYDYSNGSWSWNDYEATYTCKCLNDETHEVSFDAEITSAITLDPTCTLTGIKTYTAKVVINDITYTDTKLEELEALGHTPGDIVVENNISPTCTLKGSYENVIYCIVCNEELSREKVNVPALGHTPGDKVTENVVDATCETLGSYDEVIYCSVCDTELSRVSKTINAIGHNYDYTNGLWVWDGYETATYTCTCLNDENHKEIFNATITSTVRLDATCLLDGEKLYTAKVTIDGDTYTNTKTEVLEALGHDYEYLNGSWSWNGFEAATYTVVCKHDLTHTIVYDATIKSSVVDATCEADGLKTYTAKVEVNGNLISDIKEEVLEALGHNYDYLNGSWLWNGYISATYTCTCINDESHKDIYNATVSSAITVNATCESNGIKTYTAKVVIAGVEYTNQITEEIPAIGHEYEITYTWSLDNLEVTATAICKNDSEHQITETVATTSIIKTEAECLAPGIRRFTATFTNELFETQTKDVSIGATGHSYVSVVTKPTCEDEGYTTHTCSKCNDTYIDNYVSALGHDYTITYEWNDDLTKVIACAICKRDNTHMVVEEKSTTSEVIITPTCTASGKKTYTVTFENDLFVEQTKNVTLDMIPHTFGEVVIENNILPTCETAGSYDEVVYCSVCNAELSRETINVDALGHDYDFAHGEWVWDDYDFAKYIVTCKHDANHKVSYDAVIESELLSESTHTVSGMMQYIARVEIDSVEYEDVVIETLPMLHHQTSITVAAVEATCEEDGNILYYHCVECGRYFSDIDMTIEITLADTIVSALGHTYDLVEELAATCKTNGLLAHYYCEACGTYFDTNKNKTTYEALVINAFGHNYVSVITLPTCDDEGYTTHTCSICGDSYVDTIVNALGHDYEITYTWSIDNKTLSAKALCKTCGKEVTEEVNSKEKINPATCTLTGLKTYTAEFTNELFETQIKKVVIEALGHTSLPSVVENKVEATCTVAGYHDEVVYCEICGEELSRTLVNDPALGHDLVHHDGLNPTCLDSGYTAYDTCSRCDYTTYETIPALGHNYDYLNGSWSWNGYEAATYTCNCLNNIAHSIVLDAEITSVITAEATCTLAGLRTYTATVVINNKAYTDSKTEEIAIIPHTEGNVVIENEVLPTCVTNGSYDEVIYCTICNHELNREPIIVLALGHKESEIIKENEVLPTCETAGSYDEVVYCSVCNALLSRTPKEIQALGHNYDFANGSWSWNGYDASTYTCKCLNDIAHETVLNAEITSKVTVSPTCIQTGIKTYTAKVEVNGNLYESTKTEVIDALGHILSDAVSENRVEPTCEEAGYYDSVVYCSVCNAEISRTRETIEALGHTPSTPVVGNTVNPTCEEDGYYFEIVNCSVCNSEISRTKVRIPALGHNYDYLNGSWSWNGYEAATYTCKCLNDLTHTVTFNATITSNVTLNPTCTELGIKTYTAAVTIGLDTFENNTYEDIEALGHNYDYANGEFIWNNYDSVEYVCTCLNDSTHKTSITANIESEVIKNPTCIEFGTRLYTASLEVNGNTYTSTQEENIDKIAHTESSAQIENIVAATCEEKGSYDEVVYCSYCNAELSREAKEIPATGHNFDYTNGEFVWDGYEASEYVCTCLNDSTHKTSITATITSEVISTGSCLEAGTRRYIATVTINDLTYSDYKDRALDVVGHTEGKIVIENEVLPTCEEKGSYDEVIYCSVCGIELSRNTVETDSLGHTFGDISYEWNLDNSKVTALVSCQICAKEVTEEVATTSEIIKASTCKEEGLIRYIATFTNELFDTVSKDVSLDTLPHTEGSIVIENEVLATCEETGSYDEVVYCSVCGIELSRIEGKIIPALGHDYDNQNGSWSWNGYEAATYTVVCLNDNNHTYTYDAYITSYNDVEPSCTNVGIKIYTATVIVDGNAILTTKTETLAKLAHTRGEVVIENNILPTCEEAGSYDNVIYCTICNHELFRETIHVDALGHDYEITYEWDNTNSKVTATAICNHDDNHKVTETVDTVYELVALEDCETNGLERYTASFENSLFETQTKDIVILATGHDYDYGNGIWIWDGYTSATYICYCMNDLSHTDSYTSNVVTEVISSSSCQEPGTRRYTATVTINGNTYSDYKDVTLDIVGHTESTPVHENVINATCEEAGSYDLVVYCSVCGIELSRIEGEIIPALGHDYDYENGTFTWEGYTATYTVLCKRDNNHTLTVAADIKFEVTKNPTCTELGIMTYTASVEFDGEVYTSTKTKEIEALGHDYDYENGTFTWEGYTATYICTCLNDENHKEYLATNVVSEIKVYPTCLDSGIRLYTATIEIDGILYQSTKEEEIEALGHDYDIENGVWTWDLFTATYTVTCLHDDKHEYLYNALVTSEVTLDPTCLASGIRTYTAKVEINGNIYTSTKNESLEALGHSYGSVTYEWNSDNTKVSACMICERDSSHKVLEEVYTSISITKAPTCTESGIRTYTATFTNLAFETQIKTEIIPETSHSYDYSLGEWIWNELESATYTITCENDSNHKEVYDATIKEAITEPATCMSLGLKTYTASVVINGITYKSTKTEVIAKLPHTEGSPVVENKISSTCTETGSYDMVVYCTSCGSELSRISYQTQALGHQESDIVIENFIDATCEEPGSYDEVIYCLRCNLELHRETVEIQAYGHQYEVTYEWNSDLSKVTATAICEVCADTITEEVNTTNEVTSSASCTLAGIRTYTATFTNDLFDLQTKTNSIPALGHSYVSVVTKPTCEDEGYTIHTCSKCTHTYVDNYTNALGHDYKIVYGWNDDLKEVTACAICKNDSSHVVVEVSSSESEITLEPTCEESGTKVYTATFTNTLFEMQTKTISLEKLGHTLSEVVVENNVLPTCETYGSYDNVIYCSICNKEISREKVYVDALGHNYDYEHATFIWNDFEAVLEVVCLNDNNHKLTYNAIVESKVISSSTHTARGMKEYTARITIDSYTFEETVYEELPLLHHATSITILPKEATCEEDGNILYYHCKECGTYFKDLEMTIEIELSETIIPAFGHTYGDLILEVNASCEDDGLMAHYYCETCGTYFNTNKDKVSYDDLVISKLGHDYKEEITLPTCETNGYTTYTCTRCKDSYIDNVVEAFGHDYEITYEWNSDLSKVIATAICKHDNNHQIIEEVKVITDITINPTCEDDGLVRYTAKFNNSLFSTQTKEETVLSLGHILGDEVIENLVEATCLLDGSHDKVIYCTRCNKELSRENVLDNALGHDLIHHDGKAPTCLESGYKEYDTCSRCEYSTYLELEALGHLDSEIQIENNILPTCENEGSYDEVIYCLRCNLELQRNTLYVEALGHSYGEASYEWNNLNTKVTATITCDICNESTIVSSRPQSKVIKEPTCEEDGLVRYTAIFTNELFETQVKEEIIPALGHIFDNLIQEVQASCTEDGFMKHYHCTICGKYFSYEGNEVSYDDLIIPSLGHDYSEVVTNPTCIDEGYTTHTCSRCNDSYKDNYVDALGHDYLISYIWGSNNEVVRAYAKCNLCDKEIIEESNTTYTLIEKATCESSGEEQYVSTFLNNLFESQTKTIIIPALGHSYGGLIEKFNASCETDGLMAHYYCQSCGKYFDEDHNEVTFDELVINALGHNPSDSVTENVISATCNSLGSYDEVIYCSICNEELSRNTIYLSKLQHQYQSVVTKPTCDREGYTTHTCSLCNDSYIDSYKEALGHSYINPEYEWNSDNTKVIARIHCERCNDLYEVEVLTSESIIKEATCDAEGQIRYTALFTEEFFNSQQKTIIVSKLEHVESDIVIENLINPTCETYGSYVEVRYCINCNKELSRFEKSISPLNHDYDYENGSWSWNNYSTAEYTCMCKNDNSHISSFNAIIESKTIVEATYSQTGLVSYTARVVILGITYSDVKEEEIPALSHTITTVYEISATCVDSGNIRYYYCTDCGKYFSDLELLNEITLDDTIILPLGHLYSDLVEGIDATCTNNGHISYYTCNRCNNYFDSNKNLVTYDEIVLLKTGHNYLEDITKPTCIDSGYTTHTCSYCNDSYIDSYVSALGHSYKDATYLWNLDHTSIVASVSCSRCNHEINEDGIVTIKVTKKATCTLSGVKTFTATFTNALFDMQSYEIVLEALGHTESEIIDENIISPTCLAPGSKDEVIYCLVCNEELSREEITIASLGHDLVNHDGKEATCLESGYKAYETCNRCGYTTYEEIMAKGHNESEITYMNVDLPTCISTGSHEEVIYCLTCNKILSKKNVIDAALGHDYSDLEVLPTCTEQGYTTHTCLRCGKSYVDSYINSLGHDFSLVTYEWSEDHTFIIAKLTCCHDNTHYFTEDGFITSQTISLPDCENDGLRIYRAQFTNPKFETQTLQVTLEKLGHDLVHHDGKTPTCLESGYKEYDTCNRCDYTTYEYIEALGHKQSSIITENSILPTCTLTGSHDEVVYCLVCNKELSRIEVIDNAKGHIKDTPFIENNILPTCLNTGSYDLVTKCMVCENELSRKNVIVLALGHDLVSHDGLNPTCLNDGYKEYETCSRCDFTTYQIINKLGHSYDSVITNPTCETLGYTTHTCIRCMDSYKDTYVNMLGHDYGKFIITSTPTEELSGLVCRICKNDSSHKDERVINKLNLNDYKYDVIKLPTMEEYGIGRYSILIENETLTVDVSIAKVIATSAWIIKEYPNKENDGLIERSLSSGDIQSYRIPKLDSTEYEFIVITEATQDMDGYGKYQLNVYGSLVEIGEVIPMYGYTYTYYNKGTIVKEYHGYKGDKVEVPNNPSDYAVDGYIYSFFGWDKEIPNELRENLTFNAIFTITQVVNDGIIIEIPNSVIIDSSYKVIVSLKEKSDYKQETKMLESSNAYDSYDLTSLFDVYFEKDGVRVTDLSAKDLKIFIQKDAISGLESDTKLFYFDDEGKVHEVAYKVNGDYVEFILPSIGNIGFGNDNVTWVWTVLEIQTSGLMVLVLIIFIRRKQKAKRA